MSDEVVRTKESVARLVEENIHLKKKIEEAKTALEYCAQYGSPKARELLAKWENRTKMRR